MVYTKEAETADSYIEKFAHKNSNKYDITVATSDRLEQMIIMGNNALKISAKEFKAEIEKANDEKFINDIFRRRSFKAEGSVCLFDFCSNSTHRIEWLQKCKSAKCCT